MKMFLLFFTILFLTPGLYSQDFSGIWEGKVQQDGKTETYHYQIDLTQTADNLTGFATSTSESGTVAKFEIGGIWDGKILAIQEVHQTEPPGAKWCLKHIRLSLIENSGNSSLKGRWEAQGCKPGVIELWRPTSHKDIKNALPIGPSSFLPGKWTGHLTQSDRDYGFYFEMKFKEDGTGTSHITSDGEGGNAAHHFNWTWNESLSKLDFVETTLLEESVPSWRWCMKSGSLAYKKETNRLSLAGDWSGFLEGFSLSSGACAPGKLYVEKPLFKEGELLEEASGSNPDGMPNATPLAVADYETRQKRDVEVDRVLEVKNKTIRIRVWDNGTVDGDVCTLFLNGEMILKNYRVTRSKHETIVKLEQPVNYIILHAVNLGSITPNTIAVSVDDGTEEQVVIVSSNLKSSGAIMIREFTVGD